MALWILLYHLNINELIYSGISYGSHYLAYFYHCCYFIKMTLLKRDISGFRLSIYGFFITHITTPVPLPKVCWSGNVVYTPLPLHPYHSIATLEWHCSVNLHICDALQWHFGGTLQRHSQSTLQRHSGVHTPLPLRYYHSDATLKSTLQCHSGVSLEC